MEASLARRHATDLRQRKSVADVTPRRRRDGLPRAVDSAACRKGGQRLAATVAVLPLPARGTAGLRRQHPDAMATRHLVPPTAAAPSADDRWAGWDCFVAAHRHGSFMQSSAWMRCRRAEGYAHIAVVLRDERREIVGGAVVGRWSLGEDDAFYYVQDGPLLPDDPELAQTVMEGLLAHLDRHRHEDEARVSHLRIEPRCPVDAWPAFASRGFAPPSFDDRFREPRHTRCVDLRGTGDERLAAMTPKGRYNVRLARRHGVQVVEDRSERGFADFLALRGDTARRRRLGAKSRRYFADILRAFGPQASLAFAELDGQRLATALVLRFADRATYLFGGSLPQRREVMAPYLLHHEIMNRLADDGCAAYDLYGTSPPGDAAHPWASISAFKRRLGGVDLAFVPTLDLVYDAAGYARFAAREGRPLPAGTPPAHGPTPS